MPITCAITRSGIATASSGVFHQTYLPANGFNASRSIGPMVRTSARFFELGLNGLSAFPRVDEPHAQALEIPGVAGHQRRVVVRSEERRVGKECRSRWS